MTVSGPTLTPATGVENAAVRAVDAVFERFFETAPAPGIAYGLIADGALVYSRGLGTLAAGTEHVPDANSVFRIASMTKSFTAAAILQLRDAGQLVLDEPVATYVPDLANLRGPTLDSPPVTVRHLLTHTAGFATDDPWGDRMQGLDLSEFARVLRAGPTFAFAPGTRFEYSNLGYGILGRVITNVSGIEYRDYVTARILQPLGMTSSVYDVADVPQDRRAHGYVRREGTWREEPIDGYGALAAMGGLFSTVHDLARWVAFLGGAHPPRDEPEGDTPLSRASRREMQLPHISWPPDVTFDRIAGEPIVGAGGYGFGVTINQDLGIGAVMAHGGGYPGFGSNMRWHPASGLGLVSLGNARYVNMSLAGRDALRAALRAEPTRSRRIQPWPATEAARRDVEDLFVEWDDELAARLFSVNIELDEPLAERRARIEKLRALHGRLVPDDSEPATSTSPAHLEWWLVGERGCVKVEILLSPEPEPRVQTFDVTSVPEPGSEMSAVAQAIVGAIGATSPAWPAGAILGPKVDREVAERELRAAGLRYGVATLGRCVAGDGERKATWRVTSARGDLELRLERDPDAGQLTAVAFQPRALKAPFLVE
jgi:serine-type D-Ala-D-Ala carboxypeptidase/endopeptidase